MRNLFEEMHLRPKAFLAQRRACGWSYKPGRDEGGGTGALTVTPAKTVALPGRVFYTARTMLDVIRFGLSGSRGEGVRP
jgi:hypothetical protein